MAVFSFSLSSGDELPAEMTVTQRSRWNSQLYQLTEQLRYVLGHLGDENFGSGGISAAKVNGLSGEVSKLAQAEIGRAKIGAAQIQHLEATVALIATAVIRSAVIDWAHIDELVAEVARIARAEIGRADIGAAQISDLSAEVARIFVADVDTMDVKWADIASLTAAVAEIAQTKIGSADIDFAHIKDLVAGTSIITKGEAGKLFIANLAVTEANMGSLSVGELLVKGQDGAFYAVSIGEDGQVVTTKKEVVGSDLADGSIDGGTKIIESSITAKQLNVAQIFGDEAVIRVLTASEIFTHLVKTNLLTAGSITTPMLASGVGATLDISGNVAITRRVTRDEIEEKQWQVEVTGDRTVLRPEAQSAVLTARVLFGGFDVTEQVDASALYWPSEERYGKQITLGTAQVDKQTNVRCFLDTEMADAEGLVLTYETPSVGAYSAGNSVLASPKVAAMDGAAWVLCGEIGGR